MDWLHALGLLLIAFVAAIGGLLAANALQGPQKRKDDSLFEEAVMAGERDLGTVFIFDGEAMIDATPSARQILFISRGRGSNWLRLIGYLTIYVPDVENELLTLAERGRIVLEGRSARGKTLLILAELKGGLTRITLTDPTVDGKPMQLDALTYRAMSHEVEDLRKVLDHAPVLIWRETEAGEVVWANTTYILKAVSTLPLGKDLSWPLPRMFERIASQQTVRGQRAAVTPKGEDTAWYDLVGKPSGAERLLFAIPADAAVNAESALREFMLTLTKTFAHLPTGLAIFDHKRQLQLFNPALLDLTGLPADFLSLRPSLLSVLDALRDRNMIPEPKDYRSWRRQLMEMEKAASSGLYEEMWNLPDGQTFKVVGRPHPNGALALMIEDVTNEVSRTRRYRSDLELGQSVIDEMDEAVAVFSPAGQLVMSNLAYASLWAHEPEGAAKNDMIRSVAAHWRSLSAPGAVWSEAEEYISTVGNRVPWTANSRLKDGRLLNCRFAPLAGGATLAGFRAVDPTESARPVVKAGSALKSA